MQLHGHPRGAPRRARRARASSTSATWARSSCAAPRRARRCASGSTANDVTRARATATAQYALLCLRAGRHRRRRRSCYRLGADALPPLRQRRRTRTQDFAWMREHAGAASRCVDRSAEFALLALQGPRARDESSRRSRRSTLAALRRFAFADGEVAGAPALVSRTGYTGEDGFEIYLAGRCAGAVWDALLAAGAPRWPRARRARRARHAAARGGPAALRQRHRRRHDAARGRPRLGREARQGRLHRPRGARRGRRRGRAPAPRRLRDGRSRRSRAMAIASCTADGARRAS